MAESWKRSIGDLDLVLTNAELDDGFELPGKIEVPPCGNVYPEGVTLELWRLGPDRPGHPFAHYVAESSDASLTPMVSLTRMYAASGEPEPCMYDVYISSAKEREDAQVQADPVASMTSDGSPLPFGVHPYRIANCKDGMAQIEIANAVRHVVFGQAAAIQCEIIRRERERCHAPQRQKSNDLSR